MKNPLPKLDLLGKRLPATVAAIAVLVVAAATGLVAQRNRGAEESATRTDRVGVSTTFANTSSSPSTSVGPTSSTTGSATTSTSPVTGDTTTPSTSANRPDNTGGPDGIADQFDFPMGGADGSQEPSCDPDDGDVVDGVVVYPASTVTVIEPSVICFPSLGVGGPVEVTITAPGGESTTTTASITDGVNVLASSPVPYVDFTRHAHDPVGDYSVEAHGTSDLFVTVHVADPDHPVVGVVESEDSIEIVAAGFPRSERITIGLYREPEPAPSVTFNLVRSFAVVADERGSARASVRMPPDVAGTNLYGVLTVPDASSADGGGDANGRLIFRWPSR